MADLETKLAREEAVGYCSDSDNEDDGLKVEAPTDDNFNTGMPMMANTGPKGVLKDYKLYKKLKQIEKEEDDRQAIELHKKLAFSADPNKHPDIDDDELFDEDDDEFLKQYHEKRLAQMKEEMEQKQKMKTYGKLFDYNGEDLLQSIEEQDKNSIMVVHIYDSISACMRMNECLEQLIKDYPHIKFCKVLASNTGLSLQFKMNALPTLQVYQGGQLIGNYLRMNDHLDKEFYPGDVENFLIESGVLCSSKDLIPS